MATIENATEGQTTQSATRNFPSLEQTLRRSALGFEEMIADDPFSSEAGEMDHYVNTNHDLNPLRPIS